MKFAVRRESSSAGQVMHARKKAGPAVKHARVGDLEPTETYWLAGTWQIAFLGQTEPRAARPEEMPASDPSRPPVGPTVNDAPASHLLVPYIISRQARGERKASAGSQAGRSGALTRPAAEPAQAFFLALGLPI